LKYDNQENTKAVTLETILLYLSNHLFSGEERLPSNIALHENCVNSRFYTLKQGKVLNVSLTPSLLFSKTQSVDIK
jgi:hypothetical protein